MDQFVSRATAEESSLDISTQYIVTYTDDVDWPDKNMHFLWRKLIKLKKEVTSHLRICSSQNACINWRGSMANVENPLKFDDDSHRSKIGSYLLVVSWEKHCLLLSRCKGC